MRLMDDVVGPVQMACSSPSTSTFHVRHVDSLAGSVFERPPASPLNRNAGLKLALMAPGPFSWYCHMDKKRNRPFKSGIKRKMNMSKRIGKESKRRLALADHCNPKRVDSAEGQSSPM